MLFDITGGKDLGLKEVEAVSEKISGLNPRAKIIFGISENPKYKGKIKIILIAVSDGEEKKEEKSYVSKSGKIIETKKGGEVQKKKIRKKEKVKIKTKKSKGEEHSIKKEKIRRSALEIKKAEKEAEEKEWMGEPEWEIPTFLRRKLK
jgi:cell division GTPase FtsZ